MTTPRKDQPAFPTTFIAIDDLSGQGRQEGMTAELVCREPGMTKLEYFAAAAMQGLMRHPDCVGEREEVVAAWAIAAAKALLDELEKEKQ